jgi:hypothetical protein
MSQDFGTQETAAARADFLVERRGFEPHASGRCIRGHQAFSIERDLTIARASAAGLSIDFMNRDALFGDPLANDRVDHGGTLV